MLHQKLYFFIKVLACLLIIYFENLENPKSSCDQPTQAHVTTQINICLLPVENVKIVRL